MGILPHTDVDAALDLALSLDIPFWPQLPRLSYYEDMYVQVSENFPGIRIDLERRRVDFSRARFMDELPAFLERIEDPATYRLSPRYSAVYHRFLERDLSGFAAIRGQLEGPVSFGLNVRDENDRPVLYDDEVRPLLIDFTARKAEVMLGELGERNANAFLFVDEPGLEFVFSAMSGFDGNAARRDLDALFAGIRGRRGVHLCGNPDWDFLLRMEMEVLSFNAFALGERFVGYLPGVRRFIERGGVVGWGIVPANYDDFHGSTLDDLADRLERLWDRLEQGGLPRERVLAQSLLLPATCALVNPDREKTVDACYDVLRRLSRRVREKYGL